MRLKDMTKRLLEECAKAGYTRVAVKMVHKTIPSSKNWPFEPDYSIFVYPDKEESFPKIWDITEKLRINGKTGNHGQASINFLVSHLLNKGVYHFKKGKWVKINN